MDLLICGTCGTQYGTRGRSNCIICDDPRQYVPPDGQWWTTLRSMQDSKKYHNEFSMLKNNSNLISIVTVPQFAIGQRAILYCTEEGNVLWDCITYLDDHTVRRINDLGGIEAIAISHPHYYTTATEWAKAFNCPVFYSAEDAQWIMRFSEEPTIIGDGAKGMAYRDAEQVLWEGPELHLLDEDVKVVKTGGHFPGSSVMFLEKEKKLLVADTVQVVPSGLYNIGRPPGTVSFGFMWSYPNLIPLTPDDVHKIWKSIAHLDFADAHGAFVGRDTWGDSKRRLLDSAQIVVRSMGVEHPILQESL